MRILSVTQTYFPFLEFGGPPVKVRALSKALTRRGHQVTVLTADWGLKERTVAEKGAAAGEQTAFGWQVEEEGVQAIYLRTWLRYRALSWNVGVSGFCRARLRDFDVAHIFGLYDFLGAKVSRACRATGVPYVVEPMGMFVPIVRNFWLKRVYHLLLGQRMLRGARAVVATSEQEVAELVSAGWPSAKIVLRRNGVEAPRSALRRGEFRRHQGIPADAKLVLFLGRLSAKKSPDLLLEAFAALCHRERIRGLHLAFAGPDEGGMREKLKSAAARLGVAQRVRFCGALFGEAKWNAYQDADVFVLPSQNENFGNTAVEAAVVGTPVIVTEKCGVAPLLGDIAGLVVQHEAGSMTQGVERVLTDAGLHAKLSAGGRELAARLDWDAPAREMEDLYGGMAASEARSKARACAR